MSQSNAEELDKDGPITPQWLDEQFLMQILKNNERNENVQVTNFELSPAAQAGDHYASVMFRAKVNYQLNGNEELKNISLIIKTMPEQDGHKKEFMKGWSIFETEIEMYKMLPDYEHMLRQARDDTVLAAK